MCLADVLTVEPSLWRTPPEVALSPVRNRAGPPNSPHPSLPPVYNLHNLARVLESCGVQDPFIIYASTPIIKFTSGEGPSALHCDVNVNDLGGWYVVSSAVSLKKTELCRYNSSLILHYCLISPHVLRPLIYALKRWAAAYNLNDASGNSGPSTMSSYCLTLMAIGYLQHRGILPNLQAEVGARIPEDIALKEDDCIWVGWGRDQGIKAHVGFNTDPPPTWRSRQPDTTAADAVRGFFSFFSQQGGHGLPGDNMRYDDQVISILQGGIVDRASTQGSMNQLREAKIKEMQNDGRNMPQILDILQKEKHQMMADEILMGKGDRGIQPGNWTERFLVVQDPFLWQKVSRSSSPSDES